MPKTHALWPHKGRKWSTRSTNVRHAGVHVRRKWLEYRHYRGLYQSAAVSNGEIHKITIWWFSGGFTKREITDSSFSVEFLLSTVTPSLMKSFFSDEAGMVVDALLLFSLKNVVFNLVLQLLSN
uniref:Uncharacterized protein n=1 Tax=Proboscia inermis TaxID=420281 RepID=A0A7S0CH28_9STRA